MTDFFYSIDLAIFYFFNHTLASGFLDKFFSTITNVHNWYIAYIILLGILVTKGGTKGRLAFAGIILLIAASDLTGARLLKETIERLRPCAALIDARIPAGCAGGFSFPSNHAINNFAAAFYFYKLFPNLKYPLFITAILIALSRVYLGVHYPSDILGGAVLGSIYGLLFGIGILKLNDYIISKKSESKNEG